MTAGPRAVAIALLATACSGGRDGGGGAGGGGTGGRGGSGGTVTQMDARLLDTSGPDRASIDAGSTADTVEVLPPAADVLPETAPAADATGETPKAGGKNILLVVGNENGTSMRGEGMGDKYLRARLEMQGYAVSIGGDNLPAGQLQMAAAEADLVIVSESVGSAMLQGKLKPVTTPILNYEAFIQDEMGLTPPGPPGDPGLPADFALGVKAGETRIDIVMPGHPLAAGLTGTVTVYRMPRSITWGKVAATAEVIATLPGDRAGVATYVYRKGARLQDGSVAAGLRVGFFLEDDDTTGTANFMTDEGLRLLDAAVRFTIDPGNSSQVPP
jgi:hypothetical protein